MNNKTIYKLLLILTIIFNSCEYEAQISYKITNNSEKRIKVLFSVDSNQKKLDSVYVDVNKTELLIVAGQGLSSVDNYKEKNVSLSEFSRISVYRSDTIESQTEFMLTAKWDFHENNSHSADYTAIVNDSDF
jgi:hypothetical protein